MTSNPLQQQIGGSHYKNLPIQPAVFAEANCLSFLAGCAIKRLLRYPAKGGGEDLRKAMHELQLSREIRAAATQPIPPTLFAEANALTGLQRAILTHILQWDQEDDLTAYHAAISLLKALLIETEGKTAKKEATIV